MAKRRRCRRLFFLLLLLLLNEEEETKTAASRGDHRTRRRRRRRDAKYERPMGTREQPGCWGCPRRCVFVVLLFFVLCLSSSSLFVCLFVCLFVLRQHSIVVINAEIPKPLFYEQEAKDERKLKRAYRRHALRTHPDTGGASASTEAFQEVQKAYRTLRLELASPNNEALTAEMSNDEEWEEHDWRWKVKYEKEKALDQNVTAKSQRKREEAFWRVEEMKRMAKMKEEGAATTTTTTGGTAEGGGEGIEGNLFPSRMNKKKKRVIKPISKQSSPMENFQKVQEAEKERLKREAEAKEKRINFKAFGGPDASKSSTNAAHDTINTQLEGLRRKHVLRSRYGNHANAPSEAEREKAKSIRKYQLELEDSEEERFMRLARMAKEWRNKKGGVNAWRETGSMSDDDKMTPRELLLAAVESVSLGGSQ